MLLTLVLSIALLSAYAQRSDRLNLRKASKRNESVSIYNETVINSKTSDFSPAFYGDTIVFLSARHPGPKDPQTQESFYDFYYAPIGPNGNLKPPRRFSLNLNSTAHEGQATFDTKAQKIYFTRNNLQGGVEPAATDGVVRMKIYEAQMGELDWEKIRPLPFNAEAYNCIHPTLSKDGNVMIFASNQPGGDADYDLYLTIKRNGKWTPPANLGNRINTDGNEVFPFLHESGTLFFASNGYKGYGGADIFMVESSEEGGWEKVVNLGEPFNSKQDDFGLILDKEGKTGYFSSSRNGGVGRDDIYSFDAPEGIQGVVFPEYETTTVFVYSEQANSPVAGAEVSIFERRISDNGAVDFVRLSQLSLQGEEEKEEPDEKTNREGRAYPLLDIAKVYKIRVEKRGFLPFEDIYIPGDNVYKKPFDVPLLRDDCITVEGTVYDAVSGAPIPRATIRISNLITQRLETISTDEQGLFRHCLPDGYEFSIEASRAGYVDGTTQIKTTNRRGMRTFGATIELQPDRTAPKSPGAAQLASTDGGALESLTTGEPIEVGKRFVLDNLHYEFESSEIKPEAATDLDYLATLMKDNPSLEIELIAYTDCRGKDRYNRRLSLDRAESARNYLKNKGIASNRIRAFGYGESNPLVDCSCDGIGKSCTEAEHALNRRTEVLIIRM